MEYAVVIICVSTIGCAPKATVDVFEHRNPIPQQPRVEKEEEKPPPAVTYPYPIQRYVPSMPLNLNDEGT